MERNKKGKRVIADELIHLDLFSGIGGFSYGLRLAGGFRTVGFCEIDPFCQKVLKKHWPHTVIFDDVRTVTAELIRRHCGGRIDVITAGVPCQPSSLAGERKGRDDERWMWDELLRVVREIRPRCLLAENPTGFISLEVESGLEGLDWLQDSLEAESYQSFSFICPADSVASPQERERIWIVGLLADSGGAERHGLSEMEERAQGAAPRRCDSLLDDSMRKRPKQQTEQVRSRRNSAERADSVLGDSDKLRRRIELKQQGGNGAGPRQQPDRTGWPMGQGFDQHEWEEPRAVKFPLGASANGISRRLARSHNRRAIRAIGNGVVPPVVSAIAQAIRTILNG